MEVWMCSTVRSGTDCAEYVERVVGGADDDARQLRVPVQLLDLPLSLMNKQQLCWHVGVLLVPGPGARRRLGLVRFDGEVPDREPVVGRRHSQHRAVVRIPLERRDRRRVVAERHDRCEPSATGLVTHQWRKNSHRIVD